MSQKKRRIIITEFEQRILVRMLAEYRNQLLGDRKPVSVKSNRKSPLVLTLTRMASAMVASGNLPYQPAGANCEQKIVDARLCLA